jgi:hypothetical protein
MENDYSKDLAKGELTTKARIHRYVKNAKKEVEQPEESLESKDKDSKEPADMS